MKKKQINFNWIIIFEIKISQGFGGARGKLDSKYQKKKSIKNCTIIYRNIYENRPKVLIQYAPRIKRTSIFYFILIFVKLELSNLLFSQFI
jgi:hypothetical protein